MISSRTSYDLQAEIEIMERKREKLSCLLHEGKISQDTFDLLEKNTDRLATAIVSLKQILEEDKSFRETRSQQEIGVLERLLIQLRIHSLIGEIEEKEWMHKSEAINTCLEMLRNADNQSHEDSISASPIETDPEYYLKKAKDNSLDKPARCTQDKDFREKKERPKRNRHAQVKNVKKEEKEPSTRDDTRSSEIHCRNPWKPECRNSELELTIYYKGQPTPICRRCWEEISKKDIEWSGP